MAWRSVSMLAARVAVAPLAALLAALLAFAVAAEPPTMEPVRFEAAFQGRCGEGSPCEQLCRELHDGTYECGCGPGFELHVNGYSCSEINSTKTTDLPDAEDILYQKDVSFSAELVVPPSSRLRPNIVKHITTERLVTLPLALKEDYTFTGEKSKRVGGIMDLMEDGISKTDLNIIADLDEMDTSQKVTTLGPSLEQKVPGETASPAWTTAVDTSRCDSCGNRGRCSAKCKSDPLRISTPRFSGASWLALRALRGAYKRVRVRVRVRPERTRGVLLLTGEHDDLSGDYLALILRNGHVELRFDCGSGAGILRSPEPVRLGHWNTISVYRHRWDAWLRLNNGKRVRGRSKGLFSRMTFREPVWVGGAGNTTGLQSKLGLSDGLLGCVDFLRINGDTYHLIKDAVATMDIGECAPTLAPWKPIHEATTSEAISSPNDKHTIYDINDIVNFEDNDIVMRDANIKFHDNNKLDNSVDPLNEIQKLNMAEFKNTGKLSDDEFKNTVKLSDDEFKNTVKLSDDELKNTIKLTYNKFKNTVKLSDDELKNAVKLSGDEFKNTVKLNDDEFKNDKADLVKEIQKINMVDDYKDVKQENELKIKNYDKDEVIHNDIKNYVPINDLRSIDRKELDRSIDRKELDSCDCQHGGGCVNHGCLCPLGYAGDKCEITLDLKVPRFNGSSYLRLPGLGGTASSWLDIQITLKPTSANGLVLYNSERASGDGDFVSLHLRDYFVEFAFDLGSGIALVRSAYPLEANKWHKVSVSRSGRRASLRVKSHPEHGEVRERTATRWVSSHGTARRLTLKQPLLLGGAPHPLPQRLALSASFSGCVGQLVINDEELSVVSSALGGLNVDNCEEPTDTNCTDKTLCNEVIKMPVYPQNLTENEIHRSIVPKKGSKIKYHKIKPKKHAHIDKRKKYFVSKKRLAERTNDVYTEKPYDGQTYMQIKYLSASEINWGDANTYPSFTGSDSFIHIDDEETMKRLRRYTLDINIRFRSVSPDALLVWSGRPPRDFIALALEKSVLVLRYDLGSGEVVIIANHTRVDDGLWHRARATRNRQAGVLEVDGLGSVGKISPGKHKQLNTENGLYIGGLPSIEMNTMGKYKSGLIGCVSQISLSGDYDIPLSLSKLPHTITNNVGRCTP